ncbi:MAG TPA: hypothetical protein VFM10_13165 [Terriglobales bacterium]|nr:hypothetical protein [Terriglobales bacterium]
MQNTQRQASGSDTQSQQHQGEALAIDLTSETELLQNDEDWRLKGITRKALLRYPDFRITLIAMKNKARIEEHHNPGRISVQTVLGHIRMNAAGQTFDLPTGRVLVLDRAVRHDVEALDDSAFLLTVAMPEDQTSR